VANNPPLAADPLGLPAPVPSFNRFVGSWVFPMNGLYHGPQPDVMAFDVKADGGSLSGTMNARFWPFGDIKTVTTLRFEFSGVPGTGRVLTLPLVTSDGAKGSLELIPGPAYNLLEVNFYTERVAEKMNRGNALLIRK
jgi:hypothetical protein